MKRAASPASLLDRSTPWLRWWQELILNWVASWSTVPFRFGIVIALVLVNRRTQKPSLPGRSGGFAVWAAGPL
jgi:hypothetical protein